MGIMLDRMDHNKFKHHEKLTITERYEMYFSTNLVHMMFKHLRPCCPRICIRLPVDVSDIRTLFRYAEFEDYSDVVVGTLKNVE